MLESLIINILAFFARGTTSLHACNYTREPDDVSLREFMLLKL